MKLLKRDPFGTPLFLKRLVIFTFGMVVWYRLNKVNKTEVHGVEHLAGLPDRNVLFVCNHQTYFMDASALFLVFNHVYWGMPGKTHAWWRMCFPKTNLFFVAAKETMKAGLLPRLLALAGSISIKRTWRAAGKTVDRGVDPRDIENIRKAIQYGWVITFPQGTTKPFAPGRRGTAHIIKDTQPIVVPVVIDGFRRAFDKKGLYLRKRNTTLSLTFKKPLELHPDEDAQALLDRIMDAIEQSPAHRPKNQIAE